MRSRSESVSPASAASQRNDITSSSPRPAAPDTVPAALRLLPPTRMRSRRRRCPERVISAGRMTPSPASTSAGAASVRNIQASPGSSRTASGRASCNARSMGAKSRAPVASARSRCSSAAWNPPPSRRRAAPRPRKSSPAGTKRLGSSLAWRKKRSGKASAVRPRPRRSPAAASGRSSRKQARAAPGSAPSAGRVQASSSATRVRSVNPSATKAASGPVSARARRRSQGTCPSCFRLRRDGVLPPAAARTSASAVVSRNARSSASGAQTCVSPSAAFARPRRRTALGARASPGTGTAWAASGNDLASAATRSASSARASATPKRASVAPFAGTSRGTRRSRPTSSSASFAAWLQAASEAGARSVSDEVNAASRGSASSSGMAMPSSSRAARVSSTTRAVALPPQVASADAAASRPHRKKRGIKRSGRKARWNAPLPSAVMAGIAFCCCGAGFVARRMGPAECRETCVSRKPLAGSPRRRRPLPLKGFADRLGWRSLATPARDGADLALRPARLPRGRSRSSRARARCASR